MKKILLGTMFSLIAATYALAADPSDKETGFDEFFDAGMQQTAALRDILFDLSDVDGNELLSRREFLQSLKGAAEQNGGLTSEEQNELLKIMEQKFKTSDDDGDGFLTREQGNSLFTEYLRQISRRQFDTIDSNKNGSLSADETLRFYRQKGAAAGTPEQQMQKLDNQLQKLDEQLQKLDEQMQKINDNPQEFADMLMQNSARNMAAEEFFKMDADEDRRLTRDEFINYNIRIPELADDKETAKETAGNIFDGFDVSRRGFLNEQEFVEAYTRFINEPLTDGRFINEPLTDESMAVEEFFKMDADEDRRLTRDEFINYYVRIPELADDKETTKETAGNIFDGFDVNRRGFLNEQEFVEAYTRFINEPLTDESNDANAETNHTDKE